MDSSDELEALEDLIGSPGWRLFVHYTTSEIETLYMDSISTVVSGKQDSEITMRLVRELSAVRDDRRKMAEWPRMRIAQLKSGETSRETPRRGRGQGWRP